MVTTTTTPLQIRAVPSDVLDTLKKRAAAEHLSLSAYVLRILETEARMPTLAEVLLDPARPRANVTTEEIVEMLRTTSSSSSPRCCAGWSAPNSCPTPTPAA